MQVDVKIGGSITLPFISYTKIPIDTSLCNTPSIVATSVSAVPTSASTTKTETAFSVTLSFTSYTTHTTPTLSGMITYTHS